MAAALGDLVELGHTRKCADSRDGILVQMEKEAGVRPSNWPDLATYLVAQS